MIRAVHVLIYSDDAAVDQAFLRDVLGLVTSLRLPGGGELQLHQPKHRTAYDL